MGKVRHFLISLQECRCSSCPACWYDNSSAGCSLNKRFFGFCKSAFLPHWAIKIKMAFKEHYEEKFLDKSSLVKGRF
jgi:hypothetical protein